MKSSPEKVNFANNKLQSAADKCPYRKSELWAAAFQKEQAMAVVLLTIKAPNLLSPPKEMQKGQMEESVSNSV